MIWCSSNQIAVFCLRHKSPTNSGTRTPTDPSIPPSVAQSQTHSTVQITRWPSTVHGRKCTLVTRKEFGYSALKPEQLEVITAFIGGREVLTCVNLPYPLSYCKLLGYYILCELNWIIVLSSLSYACTTNTPTQHEYLRMLLACNLAAHPHTRYDIRRWLPEPTVLLYAMRSRSKGTSRLGYFKRHFPLFPSITTMPRVEVLLVLLWGCSILATFNLSLSQDTQCSESTVLVWILTSFTID